MKNHTSSISIQPISELPDIANASVLVVGDVMLDRYWHGPTSRISPEAPVPVVKVDVEEVRVGGAGNVALNAASLGAHTHLLGLAGEDDTAQQVELLLRGHGVLPMLQRVRGCKTITKLRVMSRNQQLLRLDFEDNFPNWNAEAFLRDFTSRLAEVNAVILSDYAKGALRSSAELISIARNARKIVIVDPKGTDFERYRGATLITPNLSEFEAVVGLCANEAEIVRRGINLRDALDLEAVLVTRSEKGMTLLARGHDALHLPTRAQEVFDVTGAGDTVVATLGAALAAGQSIHEAAVLSNIAAGVVVAKLGTATVSPVELTVAITDPLNSRRCVYSESELIQKVTEARNRGEKIVMVIGCFDILHPSHIDYLEKARALGDRLIVAVNDDASIRRLMGRNRPINPLTARMRVLSALACVDWIVPLYEDTPERLYSDVLPDVLVEDGNYLVDQVPGVDSEKAENGEATNIDFLPGYSATS